jgi:hypothetical protein
VKTSNLTGKNCLKTCETLAHVYAVVYTLQEQCVDCFRLRPRFFSLVEKRQYSWGLEEHRELLRSMLMTASDIAASSKPWHVQQRVARLVTAEFIVQGDKERQELNIEPQALMDRDRQHELPQLQIRWIADICLPLYQVRLLEHPVDGHRQTHIVWGHTKLTAVCVS